MAIKIHKVGSGITESFEIWTDEPVEEVTFSEKVLAIRQHAVDEAIEGKHRQVCNRLVEQCDQLLKAIEGGDLEGASWLAFELGELRDQMVIKCGWEDHALRGEKTVTAAAEGGRARRGMNDARDREMAKEFQRRSGQGGKSDTALQSEIGRDYKLKKSAAIAAINHGLKLLSG